MEKEIKIDGVEYKVNASVLTIANYSIFFEGEDLGEAYGNVILKVNEMNELKPKPITKEEEKKLTDIEKKERQLASLRASTKMYSIILDVSKMAYTLIKEQDASFIAYKEWLKTLDNILDDPNWIYEVIGVIASVFRGMVSKKGTNGQKQ